MYPLCIALLLVTLVLHGVHLTVCEVQEAAEQLSKPTLIMQIVLAFTGPLTMTCMKRPYRIVAKVEVIALVRHECPSLSKANCNKKQGAAPAAGLVAMVVIVVIALTPIARSGCIVNKYVKASSLQDDMDDYAVHLYTSSIVCAFLLPFLAIPSIVATLTSAAKVRVASLLRILTVPMTDIGPKNRTGAPPFYSPAFSSASGA